MNNIDFPEDSDSSDDDYVPAATNEVLSEVESDGDPEDELSDTENGKGKRIKKKKGKTKKRKKDFVITEENGTEQDEDNIDKKKLNDEEKKKHADSLWASFKKDTNFKSVKNNKDELKKEENLKEPEPKKMKVTEILEFAGEEVKIEKEISLDSKQSRNIKNPDISTIKKSNQKGGLSSILSQIGKKTKITTLEKSKLDWDEFKKKEDIGEELQKYNKGKNGYLERQDFLQRADLRRFEIEKEIRTIERNKRMNNA